MQLTEHQNDTRVVLVHTEAIMWTRSCYSITELRGIYDK